MDFSSWLYSASTLALSMSTTPYFLRVSCSILAKYVYVPLIIAIANKAGDGVLVHAGAPIIQQTPNFTPKNKIDDEEKKKKKIKKKKKKKEEEEEEKRRRRIMYVSFFVAH